MNVSCSASASSVVEIVPVPDVRPPPIVMLASDPKSPASAVPADSDSGIVTLFDNAADSRAVTVTDCPSSTGFGAADRLTLGVGGGVVSLVKVSTAMGSLENLPVPAMRVMTPCGLVSGLDRENSSPSLGAGVVRKEVHHARLPPLTRAVEQGHSGHTDEPVGTGADHGQERHQRMRPVDVDIERRGAGAGLPRRLPQ